MADNPSESEFTQALNDVTDELLQQVEEAFSAAAIACIPIREAMATFSGELAGVGVEVEVHLSTVLVPERFRRPRPCSGCADYAGFVSPKAKLCCAMHPHGPEGDRCPDHRVVVVPHG